MEKTTTSTCGGGGGDHHLNEDFCIQILVCLPVKSLFRFKSVCKSWRDLIDSSFFIDLHTTFNSSSSKFGAFILQTIDYCHEEEIKLFKLSSGDGDGDGGTGEDDDNNDKDDQKKKKKVFKLDNLGLFPFYKDFRLNHTLRMVGSCNGIICLHDPMLMESSTSNRHNYLNLRDVYLWNPATRQFRILPKWIPIEEKQYYMAYWLEDFIAFGFDVKTKDYKVLRITPWEDREEGGFMCKGGFMCRVQVYSLSTDSWRLLEGIDSLPAVPKPNLFQNHGIYLNGSYFFDSFFHRSNRHFMLSFDFTKEIFTDMQLPDYNIDVLSYLGDKMAFFTTPRIYDYFSFGKSDDGYRYYDIWVLNEQHGGGGMNKLESWTKLHSFPIKISEVISEVGPRCISNNGEFALLSTGRDDKCWRNKFQLYNLITKEAKMDFTIGEGKCRADVYQESLVSILGGALDPKKTVDEAVKLKWEGDRNEESDDNVDLQGLEVLQGGMPVLTDREIKVILVDGGWKVNSGVAAFIVQDCDANFLRGKTVVMEARSAAFMEAVAIKLCMREALQMGLNKIQIFSDALSIVKAVTEDVLGCPWEARKEVEEIISMLNSFEVCRINFFRREHNSLADKLVKRAFQLNRSEEWNVKPNWLLFAHM